MFLVNSAEFSCCDSLNRARSWLYWDEGINGFLLLLLDQLESVEVDEDHGYAILASDAENMIYLLPLVKQGFVVGIELNLAERLLRQSDQK